MPFRSEAFCTPAVGQSAPAPRLSWRSPRAQYGGGRRHAGTKPTRPARPAGVAVSASSSSGDDLRRGGGYQPYPFEEAQYHRVALQHIQMSANRDDQGFLLLRRVDLQGSVQEPDRFLLVSVGGDVVGAIAGLFQGRGYVDRPKALDLLWQVLSRGRDISSRDWSLMRVAIVGVHFNTFLGRIWFGTQDKVLWDCDARPSDSIWLSLKSNCPFFVHRDIWDQYAKSLQELTAPQTQQQRARGASTQATATTTDLIAIRASDPELIKRMKSELRVLVQHEQYEQAAKLWSHPVMVLYFRHSSAIDSGDAELTYALDQALHAAIAKFEAGEPLE